LAFWREARPVDIEESIGELKAEQDDYEDEEDYQAMLIILQEDYEGSQIFQTVLVGKESYYSSKA
jgi:hypothetical protein